MPKRRRPGTDITSRPERPAAMRVDKWLFCARVTKTRSEAAHLVEAGAVRINRVKARKPAMPVHVGDVITLVRHERVRVVRILALADRRVSPKRVSTLLEDL